MFDQVFNSLAQQRPEFRTAMETWNSKLYPELASQETERKNIISKARGRTITVGIVCFTLAVIVGIVMLRGAAFPFIFILAIVATGVGSAAAWMPLMTMKSQTKQLIVGSAAEAFGFTYETLHPDVSGINDWRSAKDWLQEQKASGSIEKAFKTRGNEDAPTPAFEVLQTAKLLPSYDKCKFEDLIKGNRAEANFSLVECKLTESQGSGKNRRTVTTFQGLLIHIEYPERFLGRTLIARKGWWKGWFGDKSLSKIDLVSKELSDNFTIYSNDQVEARALLTPDRMERLIALERHFKGGKLRGIFEGDHLTIALEAEDQFEAGSIWKSLVDSNRYISALKEIGLVCDLIDGFLTRDWVKTKL